MGPGKPDRKEKGRVLCLRRHCELYAEARTPTSELLTRCVVDSSAGCTRVTFACASLAHLARVCHCHIFFTLIAGRRCVSFFLLSGITAALFIGNDWERTARRLCHGSVRDLDDQSDNDNRLKATERWRLHDFDQHVFDAGVGVASTTDCLLAWYPQSCCLMGVCVLVAQVRSSIFSSRHCQLLSHL